MSAEVEAFKRWVEQLTGAPPVDAIGHVGFAAVLREADRFEWTHCKFPLASVAGTSITHYNRLCARLSAAGFWGES